MNEHNHKLDYKDEVKQYTKRDAVHAMLFAVYVSLITLGYWLLMAYFEVSGIVEQLFGILVVLAALLPLFYLITRIKRQKLRSLGLHLANWKKAVYAGIFFVAVLLMLYNGLLPGLLAGWEFQPAWIMPWIVVYTLIMAFWEDVVFFGYIQSRLYGLINKDIQAVLVGGLIFAFFHYPLVIVANIADGGSFRVEFWVNILFQTVVWLIIYLILNAVFRRYCSIIPVTMLHFAINFANGRLWVNGGGDGLNQMLSFGIVILSVLIVTLILPKLKNRVKS